MNDLLLDLLRCIASIVSVTAASLVDAMRIVEILGNWLPDVITAAATLFAAYLGARYAFRLHDRDRERSAHREHVKSGNEALFILMRQANELENINVEIIEPHRGHPIRALTIPPAFHADYSDLKIDIRSLHFLLEKGYSQLLFELSLHERQFQLAINHLDERSEFHLNTVQPLLEAAGVQEGVPFTDAQARMALGERNYVTIERRTEGVIEILDSTRASTSRFGDELFAALKGLYPRDGFLKFSPMETDEIQAV